VSILNSVPHCVESFDSNNSSDRGRATRVLTVFEVQPGNEMQGFHREDMFWPYAIPTFSATAIQFPCASELTLGVLLCRAPPVCLFSWHHEPDAWSTNLLWALDDFFPENGGTQVIPYSHRSTLYMRENGREMLDGK
jgi:ectoine hydroxylase-related dioxygenase (phytanoyl-CoA dioxygenase family)